MKGLRYLSDSELDFISGKFFDVMLPREWRYLEKYFQSDVQRQFLKYYYVFRNSKNFVDHTGFHCTRRWLRLLRRKIEILMKEHAEAKANFDLEKLALIESGKFKFKYRNFAS